jgi:hypothetical protein
MGSLSFMSNSHSLSLVVALSILTGCLSDDAGAELEPDAAAPPSCAVSPGLAYARRLCIDHCDAGSDADGCSPADLYDFKAACRTYCVTVEVPDDCSDEAARDWVCLSQVEWTCEPGTTKPAPPVDACALTREVLARCVKGGA